MIIIDTTSVTKSLDNLSRNLKSRQHKNAVVRAARKAANLMKDELKSMIPKSDKPFEHLNVVRRSIRVLAARTWRLYPGVNITFKGPDVPVGQGKNRRFWKIAGYAYLVLFGNYQTPKRPTRSSGQEKGNVKGIGKGNIFKIVAATRGSKVLSDFGDNLKVEIEKEIAKSVR